MPEPTQPQPKKPSCPECDTEVILVENKVPEKCAKCGFYLKEYAPFERMLNAYFKRLKAANPQQEQTDDLPSFLRGLRDL